MILPGKIEGMRGVIGTTFDAIFLVYPSEYARFKWPKQTNETFWRENKEYSLEEVIIGSDGKAYVCKIVSTNINPVGDETGHWEKLTPFNLTDKTAEVKINGSLLESGVTLGGSEGTISIKAAKEITEKFLVGKIKLAVLIKDEEENIYEYVKAQIEFEEQ